MKSPAFLIIMTIIIILTLSATLMANNYPRIANLWGCPPNTTDFKTWARYDMLVCYESPYDTFISLGKGLREINSDIVILGTTPLANFARPDEWYPWIKSEWRLKNTKGEDITWWAGQVYTPNLLADGCIDALVDYVDGKLGDRGGKTGDLLREGVIQGLMHDSVVSTISWQGDIDTDLDGIRDNFDTVNKKWSDAQNLYFSKLRERFPNIIIMANDADDAHMPFINSRLWESARNLDLLMNRKIWSILDVINKTNEWMESSVQPPYSFSIASSTMGYDTWRIGLEEKSIATKGEIDKAVREFDRMRLGLFTTLMTDAYYGYDFGTVYYGNTDFWYAEFDAPLGTPVSKARIIYEKDPKTIFTWKSGEKTTVFNGRDNIGNLTEKGYLSTSDDDKDEWKIVLSTNNKELFFEPNKNYEIEIDVKILERATDAFQFALRSEKGGWEFADRSTQELVGTKEKEYKIKFFAKPGDFNDYRIEGFLKGNGSILITGIKITETGEYYVERDFSNGKVILNAMSKPVNIKLSKTMQKIKDDIAPKIVIEVDNEDNEQVFFEKNWINIGGEFNRYYGKNYSYSKEENASFTWNIKVPEDDEYEIFASLPGDFQMDGWKIQPESEIPFTLNAVYKIDNTEFYVNQSNADGGWVKIGNLDLKAEKTYNLSLKNAGDGKLAADCIRLESKARRNDGTVVNEINLNSMDGIILLDK